MKNFQSHYDEFRSLLRNESWLGKEALRERYEKAVEDVQPDTDLYDLNDTDRDVILALMHRIERMHSLGHHDYVRDDISQLTFYPEGHVSVTFNSHWNQRSEQELYQTITGYLNNMFNKGGNFGPQDERFFSGEIHHKVAENQMKEFAETLTKATHQIANHIIDNVSNYWAWKPDIFAYVFYVFEKFFDYSYHMMIGDDASLDFEPDALYESPDFDLPLTVERKMYEQEDKLYDIVKDMLDFIEETDICNSNNIICVRTIMFNIGLAAFQTVGRTEKLK